jgi:uncharacterized caspase-like protein
MRADEDRTGPQGFEVLQTIKDAKRTAILGAVRDLVRRLNAAGAGAIGFIYYSGHGAAEKDTNINYLIPVDAKEPGTAAFWDESVKLDDVLRLLDGARAAAKFIVFDACRSELQLPTKDTTKGLVPVAEQQGMFIAYASAPGHTASDRGQGNGPYAAALAAELRKPGLDHLNLFQNVKEDVLTSTGGTQQPWESNGLGRRVYLTGQPPAVVQPSPAADQEAIALKEQLTRLTSELKKYQETGVGNAKEIALLKEQLAKSQAQLARRESQQASSPTIATRPRSSPNPNNYSDIPEKLRWRFGWRIDCATRDEPAKSPAQLAGRESPQSAPQPTVRSSPNPYICKDIAADVRWHFDCR